MPDIIQVDPTNTIRAAEQQIEDSVTGSRSGPWLYNGRLYLVGQTGFGTPSGRLVVYRSLDGGLTWAEIDAGNGPATQFGDAAGQHWRTYQVARDGVDRSSTMLYVAYASPVGAPPGDAFVAYCPFNLVTESWGVPSISAFSTEPDPPSAGDAPRFMIEYRPIENDLVIAHSWNNNLGVNSHKVYTASLAGVWAFIGILTQLQWMFDCVSCISHAGGSDWVHFFWVEQNSPAPGIGTLQHQSLNGAGALSPVQNILPIWYAAAPAGWMGTTTPGPPAQQLQIGFTYGDAFGDGQDVAFPFMARSTWFGFGGPPVLPTDLVCVGQIVRGTPGGSPVWAVEEFYREPGVVAGPAIQAAPWFDGCAIFRHGLTGRLGIMRNGGHGWMGVTQFRNVLVELDNTAPGVWTGFTFFEQTEADRLLGMRVWYPVSCIGANNIYGLNLRVGYGNVGPTLQNNDDVITMWAVGAGGPPVPVAVAQNQSGFRRMVILIPNKFDLALAQELKAHLRARPQRQCYEPLVYHDLGVIRAPKNFIPFRKTAGIPTPLAASGDVEVVNFRVPAGYDGVIAGLFHYYNGPGFAQGNGDIQWRIAINRVYAIHLGNVLVQLGSVQQAFPVDGGIFIQSGNIIRYIVNVPNLSGGILPLATQIVCGLEGLFYARS